MPPKSTRQSTDSTTAPLTIREVAKRAGVSTATVSRVLSGQLVVSEELTERVHAAVRELNYQPNRTTRRHRKAPNKIIGLVAANIHSPFIAGLIDGITSVLEPADCTLIICDSADDPRRELVHLDTLRFEGVGGIILVTTNSDEEELHTFVPMAPPLVAVDRKLSRAAVDTVTVDYAATAAKAVEGLIAAGRKRLALLDAPARTSAVRERRAGYSSALAAAGIKVSEELVHAVEDGSAVETAQKLLALDPPPDAILAGSARFALDTLRVLHERGLRAPHNVTVLSFETLGPNLSDLLPVQVVAPDAFELGATAARMLLERGKHRRMAAREVLLESRVFAD